MATYISLLKFTKEGIENIKESPTRLDNARRAFQAFGGEMQAFYLVMGQYDAVVIAQAPDNISAAKVSLLIGSAGAVKTETLTAFEESEYREIIDALP